MEQLYALQIEFEDGGNTVVLKAATGELLAQGEWGRGSTAYKTDEECFIF